MSRRTDYSLPTGEQILQDEETVSATGEGDEEMEDAEDQEEGYSTSFIDSCIRPVTEVPPISFHPLFLPQNKLIPLHALIRLLHSNFYLDVD